MIDTPWGLLPVADAHVHFFSQSFFASLAEQKGVPVDALAPILNWQLPPADPRQLADVWSQELDRHGVEKAALIASVPGDGESVMAAVRHHPERFYGYMMVNPAAQAAVAQVEAALASGHIQALCFFPAMHRYSIQDDRAIALLELLAAHPRTVAFVHCGVLSVGVRKALGLPSPFDMKYLEPHRSACGRAPLPAASICSAALRRGISPRGAYAMRPMPERIPGYFEQQ